MGRKLKKNNKPQKLTKKQTTFWVFILKTGVLPTLLFSLIIIRAFILMLDFLQFCTSTRYC
jgi:hypothetical protein